MTMIKVVIINGVVLLQPAQWHSLPKNYTHTIVKKNLEVEMVCCDNALFGQTMAQYAHTGKLNDIYNP